MAEPSLPSVDASEPPLALNGATMAHADVEMKDETSVEVVHLMLNLYPMIY